jgi:hypothetical protein
VLAATLKDDTINKMKQKNERQYANASAKTKELQPNPQADTVAAHLFLPQRTTTFTDSLTIK